MIINRGRCFYDGLVLFNEASILDYIAMVHKLSSHSKLNHPLSWTSCAWHCLRMTCPRYSSLLPLQYVQESREAASVPDGSGR
jgi:hypothetical protein